MRRPGAAWILLGVVLSALAGGRARGALGEKSGVSFGPAAGAFPLAGPGAVAPICTDPHDWPGVLRAAADLQADIGRVAGQRPLLSGLPPVPDAAAVIVAGTLGHSAAIDDLIRRGKLDPSPIAGRWESCLRQVVANPYPGVTSALVIVGADKRGTIYGLYDLSEDIGVSPWAWWADVPVIRHPVIRVAPGRRVTGSPAVKYRGIFLNDEAPALTGWVKEKFGTYDHRFYAHIFELLLRLRANYLWPAMWSNRFAEDDPLNARLADEYGIVMGTSHVEPMMRADHEWGAAGFSAADWNYATHPAELERFWRDGLARTWGEEEIVTVGMRGKIDTPMAESANIALLERIVAAQRRIIGEVSGRSPAQVPQLWCLYKEVQEYYNRGMRVPDDVTLLWSDDNWGNLRRLPTPAERDRVGGAGIYYHLDYVGGPRSYKWLDTVPLPKIWEQLRLAWNYGANRVWIVNVGALKGKELPLEFFLRYAWDPARWPADQVENFTREWAAREFGAEPADEIAAIVSAYGKFNGRRKPELLSPDTFSLADYHEAEQVAADWRALASRAARVNAALPSGARAAFFQLVFYPVEACAVVNELYLTVAQNRRAAAAGDPATRELADQARALFQADADLARAYNEMENGRWRHFMDQPHLGYSNWQQPSRNLMPAVVEVPVPAPGGLQAEAPARAPRPRPAGASASAAGPFVESDGYVSMEAAHYARAVNGAGVSWEVIPDFGRTLSGVDSVPVTAASSLPGREGPRLEYNVQLSAAGPLALSLVVAPTLDFVPGRGLRAAVSLDDDPPQTVDFLADRSLAAWERAVSDGVRLGLVHVRASAGSHVLKFWRVDPGVVLEKIILDAGGVQPSYLGPPESPRGSALAVPSSASSSSFPP